MIMLKLDCISRFNIVDVRIGSTGCLQQTFAFPPDLWCIGEMGNRELYVSCNARQQWV